jgi:putative ABC transport system substrate-binding protein
MKRSLMFLLMVVVVVVGGIAKGQQPKKMARIGYLSWLSRTSSPFKEGLRELGWVEGKHIEIEYRNTGDDLDKLSEFATELVRLKVDVIVTAGSNRSTIAAKRATTTIPIVMVEVVDPVTNGLVASLARPGGNVTGVTFEVTPEQAGKKPRAS